MLCVVPRTKGVSFANARAWVEERFGRDAYERVLGRLGPEDAAELRASVAMGWYELSLHSRLLRALDAELGTGDLALVSELGRWEADRDFTLIHRIVLRFASPSIILRKLPDIWKRYYDHGTWEIVRDGDVVIGRLRGWGSDCESLRVELTSWMTRAMELVGARDVHIEQLASRARGDALDEWRATWS